MPEQLNRIMPTGLPAKDRSNELWPQWHLTVLADEDGMPYDSNGCIWWKGRYHLMYIFQDPRLPHGGHCWGHASSTDLVNWTFHKAALLPEKGSSDVGIFSGNAFINKEGKPMLCWYGIDGGVCLATADDDELLNWTKHPANPVIPCTKPGKSGYGVYTVWDPYMWLEGQTYYCLLGGNHLPDGKDTLYLMRSDDMVTWQEVGPFYEHPDAGWTTEGEDCSCPDFFKFGDQHALMCISHKIGCRLYLGRFDKAAERFRPERHIRMNWPGGKFFAADSLLDDKGRRVYWAWVTEPRVQAARQATGTGFMSLPRVLGLDARGDITFKPAAELTGLRGPVNKIAPVEIQDKEPLALGDLGQSFELEIEIALGKAQRVGLVLYASPDGGERTVIWYDPCTQLLSIDASKASLRHDLAYCYGPLDAYWVPSAAEIAPHPITSSPLALEPGEPLRLHVFVDGPMIEVFANDRQCVTQVVFPSLKESRQVKVICSGGPVRVLGGGSFELAAAEFRDER